MSLESGFEDICESAADILKINRKNIINAEIYRRSIDCRRGEVLFVYTLDVTVDGDENILLEHLNNPKIIKCEKYAYTLPENKRNNKYSPVIAGFGPAGMFAALILARSGCNPVIVERGTDIDTRTVDVLNFWNNKILNEHSNIQYGEGGAGTFLTAS